MSKNIRDYLPRKTTELQPVQARLPKDLVDQVKAIMDREDLTWGEVLTACLTKFIEEMPNKTRKTG